MEGREGQHQEAEQQVSNGQGHNEAVGQASEPAVQAHRQADDHVAGDGDEDEEGEDYGDGDLEGGRVQARGRGRAIGRHPGSLQLLPLCPPAPTPGPRLLLSQLPSRSIMSTAGLQAAQQSREKYPNVGRLQGPSYCCFL